MAFDGRNLEERNFVELYVENFIIHSPTNYSISFRCHYFPTPFARFSSVASDWLAEWQRTQPRVPLHLVLNRGFARNWNYNGKCVKESHVFLFERQAGWNRRKQMNEDFALGKLSFRRSGGVLPSASLSSLVAILPWRENWHSEFAVPVRIIMPVAELVPVPWVLTPKNYDTFTQRPIFMAINRSPLTYSPRTRNLTPVHEDDDDDNSEFRWLSFCWHWMVSLQAFNHRNGSVRRRVRDMDWNWNRGTRRDRER